MERNASSRRRAWLPAACSLLLAFLAACGLPAGGGPAPVRVRGPYPDDRAMWDHIVASGEAYNFPSAPRGAVLPHHSIAALEVGRFYRALAARVQPNTIFVLSPDHFERSAGAPLVASLAVWETVYGELEVDRELSDKLIRERLAVLDDAAFLGEHGIAFHAAFIKRAFPGARVVPILLPWGSGRALTEPLARFLAARAREGDFILASVDFSHYLPEALADFHDEASRLAIVGFDLDAVEDLEIDSPASLHTLMRSMELLGARKALRAFQTNSARFLDLRLELTTSHQGLAFLDGAAEPERGITVLLTGSRKDPSGPLPSRSAWRWDRDADPRAARGSEGLLVEIRGAEDRLFTGVDLCLFDVEPGLRIRTFRGGALGVLGLPGSGGDLASIESLIAEARSQVDALLVVFQKVGEPTEAELVAFHSWIEAGADVVAGRYPGAFVEERWLGKPILHGLGTFLGGAGEDSGSLVGLAFEGAAVLTYAAPIVVNEGIPRLAGPFDPAPQESPPGP